MKPLIYLSPTSYMEWNHCAAKFVTKRLMGYPRRQDTQGKPAAMGCAFDAFIKRWLASRKPELTNRPDLSMESLVEQISRQEDREQIIDSARSVAIKYTELNLGNQLFKENLYDLELDIFHMMGDVRLFGKLDAACNPDYVDYCPGWDGEKVALDWKVRGYGSKSKYSPTPGYKEYVTFDGKRKPFHVKNSSPLEDLNDRWAIQLSFYAWMLNGLEEPTKNMPVAIDEITYCPAGIVFTQIRTYISLAYQKMLFASVKKAWRDIQNLTKRPPASPNAWKCNQFNQQCEVAHLCPEFQQGKEHPLAVIR